MKYLIGTVLFMLWVPLLFLVYLACWGTADMMLEVLRGVNAVSGEAEYERRVQNGTE